MEKIGKKSAENAIYESHEGEKLQACRIRTLSWYFLADAIAANLTKNWWLNFFSAFAWLVRRQNFFLFLSLGHSKLFFFFPVRFNRFWLLQGEIGESGQGKFKFWRFCKENMKIFRKVRKNSKKIENFWRFTEEFVKNVKICCLQ